MERIRIKLQKQSHITNARLVICMVALSALMIAIIVTIAALYTAVFAKCNDPVPTTSVPTTTPPIKNETYWYSTTQPVPLDPVCDLKIILVLIWIASSIFVFLLVCCGFAWYKQRCSPYYTNCGSFWREMCGNISEYCINPLHQCTCCSCFAMCYACSKSCGKVAYQDLEDKDCCYVNCGVYCCLCFCCFAPYCCEQTIDANFVNIDEHQRMLNKYAFGNFKKASMRKQRCIEQLIKHTKIYNDVAGRDAKNMKSTDIEVKEVWENGKSKQKYRNNLKNMSKIDFPGDLAPIKTSTLTTLANDLELDTDKEVVLFHGTKIDTMNLIMKNGFNMDYTSDNSLFGRGLYFAESYQKSDQYVDDRNERRDEWLTMILARVALGKVNKTDKDHVDRPYSPEAGFDSAVAAHEKSNRKYRFREFIVANDQQCFPEYVIIYKRLVV